MSDKKNNDCFRTESDSHVSSEEIMRAGAAQARLEDHDSPCPIGDSIMGIVEANNVNWDATPDRITGRCDEH